MEVSDASSGGGMYNYMELARQRVEMALANDPAAVGYAATVSGVVVPPPEPPPEPPAATQEVPETPDLADGVDRQGARPSVSPGAMLRGLAAQGRGRPEEEGGAIPLYFQAVQQAAASGPDETAVTEFMRRRIDAAYGR